ncbi:MAG: hypothetical protein MI923_16240 [Phycisphaerales bacterium]|nr:hypothetical protein [Phycisphaerales bacterium]
MSLFPPVPIPPGIFQFPHLFELDREIRYPIDAPSGVSYTRTIGMAPNLNQIRIPYDPALPLPRKGSIVNLVLVDPTSGAQIVHRFEKIHDVTFVDSARGASQDLIVTIKDARHLLNVGAITGYYNVPHETIELKTEDQNGLPIRPDDQLVIESGTLEKLDFPKTLRELVKLCFEAMGLTASEYDTSMLRIQTDEQLEFLNADQPEDMKSAIGDDIPIFPAVKWEYANPAREAEALLNEHGYSVCLWTNGVNLRHQIELTGGDLSGKLVVVKLSEWHPQQASGVTLPPGINFEESTETATDQGTADTVVVGGRTVIEERTLLLEPVAPDLDGQVKPLVDLSYAITSDVGDPLPYGLFEFVMSEHGFIDLAADPVKGNVKVPTAPEGQDPYMFEDVLKVARQGVWKWYRLPEDQLWKLPILPTIVTPKRVGARSVRQKPQVGVSDYKPIASGVIDDNQKEQLEESGFTIDFRNGIIKFSEMRFRIEGPLKIARPAEVSLRWAYHAKQRVRPDQQNPDDPNTWLSQVTDADFYRYPPNVPLENANIVRHPELVLLIKGVPGEDPIFNLESLNKYAIKLIKERESVNQAGMSGSGSVPYLLKMSTDGLLRQITWSITNNEVTTSMSANRERARSARTAPYEEGLFKRRATRSIGRNERSDLVNFSALPNQDHGGDTPATNHTPESPSETATRPGLLTIQNVSVDDAFEPEVVPAFSFLELQDSFLGTIEPFPAEKSKNPGLLKNYVVTEFPLPIHGTGYAAYSGFAFVRAFNNVRQGDFIRPGNAMDDEDPYIGYRDGGFFQVVQFVTANDIGEQGGLPMVLVRIRLPAGKDVQRTWAKITQQESNGNNKWKYTGEEMEKTASGFVIKGLGRNFSNIQNSIELFNTGEGVEGHGVDITGGSYPGGFAVQPIALGAVVPIELMGGLPPAQGEIVDDRLWMMTVPNADDGTCIGVNP